MSLSRCSVLVLVLVLVCLLCVPAVAAAQQVHVVSQVVGPGVDFVNLQLAIDGADDGDIIVVQPGTYSGAVITNRHLTVAGVIGPAGERAIVGGLTIQDVDASRAVSVRGLATINSFVSGVVSVLDCDGPVLLEDCTVDATTLFQKNPSKVSGSPRVMFTRCSFLGAEGDNSATSATPGLPALLIELDSTVSLYDCDVTGGPGADGDFVFNIIPYLASAGGPAVRVTGGTVLVAGGTLRGGSGGDGAQGNAPGCVTPEPGGSGLELQAGLLRRLDATLLGGEPGVPAACGGSAAAGGGLVVLGGSVVDIPEELRTLEISSPIEQGGTCTIEVHGAPGQSVTLLQSLAPLAGWLGGLKGTLAGAPPFLSIGLGALDGSGGLLFTVPIPTAILPPGIEGVTFIDQVVVGAASGGGLLSTPSTLVLVDDLP
jgi:hypothetical protein